MNYYNLLTWNREQVPQRDYECYIPLDATRIQYNPVEVFKLTCKKYMHYSATCIRLFVRTPGDAGVDAYIVGFNPTGILVFRSEPRFGLTVIEAVKETVKRVRWPYQTSTGLY